MSRTWLEQIWSQNFWKDFILAYGNLTQFCSNPEAMAGEFSTLSPAVFSLPVAVCLSPSVSLSKHLKYVCLCMWWLLKHLVKHNQFVSRLLKTAVLSATHILTQIHSHTNKQTRAYCLQLKTWQDAKLDTDLFQKAKCCVVLSKAAETVKGTVHPIIKILPFSYLVGFTKM